jgi:hypothetical protein
MWYENMNANEVKPENIDMTSSQRWAYIRKDFVLVEQEQDDEHKYASKYWKWHEIKIPKEALAIWQDSVKNAEDVKTITECILEISEIIYA